MNLLAIKKKLFEPIDVAPLVFFRIAFGFIMLIEVVRYFKHDWIERYWIEPDFYFTYDGFHWLSPWPGQGMKIHMAVLGILAICIIIGLFYRLACLLFFLGFTYIFLLDKTNYLNHFYLISLLSFILIFIPANRSFSVDAWRNPASKSNWVPAWPLWWLRIQLGIVYFYGGIAKLNSDWLQGEPMRMWLADRTDFPLIGAYFTQEWMVYAMSYGGLFLDLIIFPALLWQRSRKIAFLSILTFHLMNARLFTIGIFPWFMIAATLIYFPPQQFRRGKSLDASTKPFFPFKKSLALGLGVYFLIQLLVPLRHWLYPGNVNWTEEGHRFSWHMKLRSKDADIQYLVVHEGDTLQVEMSDFLSYRQLRKVGGKPDMMIQFAHYLAEDVKSNDMEGAAILIDCYCSLNGREYVQYVQADIDYSTINYGPFEHATWLLPLQEPLK